MDTLDLHMWTRVRLAAWRSGLLADTESARLAAHLGACADCRALADAFRAEPGAAPDAHLPASMLAEWPRARQALRGFERALARRHLERCAECRQDLELLGHAPVLAFVPEWESASAPAAAPAGTTARDEAAPAERGDRTIVRIVRPRARWRQRLLVGWAVTATAAALVATMVHVKRPVVEGVPFALLGAAPAPPRMTGGAGGISVRFGPRPRSLSGPARGTKSGKLNVIPVAGPVHSLALNVRPLDVPDTSLVFVSLVTAAGDTLLSVRHRQWEFFPRRVLVIEGTDQPLEPGQYALVLASMITGQSSVIPTISRYRFELRPRG